MGCQARSQDFSWGGGGGGGVRVGSEIANLYGGPGACFPGKILVNLDYFGLHFARFHGGKERKTM